METVSTPEAYCQLIQINFSINHNDLRKVSIPSKVSSSSTSPSMFPSPVVSSSVSAESPFTISFSSRSLI